MSAYVYRCIDENGLLIYVGVTRNMGNRMVMHEAETEWWSEVDQIIVKPYKTEAEARSVEVTAIYQEAPLYNRLGVVTEKREVTVVTVLYQPGYQVTRLPKDNPYTRRTKADTARRLSLEGARDWLGLTANA
jgi:excinuclease UvrABC nuclease subunit